MVISSVILMSMTTARKDPSSATTSVNTPDRSGAVQPAAEDVINYLKEWAGDDLTIEFADRMSAAPLPQLRKLIEEWPFDAPGLGGAAALSSIPVGTLRPAVSGWRGESQMVNAALRLLLYTPSVVIESDVIHPFTELRDEIDLGAKERAEVRDALRRLVRLHPLITDGSLKLSGRWRATHPSRLISYMSRLGEVPDEMWTQATPEEHFSSHANLATLMAACILLVEENKATALAQTRNEEVALHALFSGHGLDNRTTALNTLSRLPTPDFGGTASELIRLRSDSDAFLQWRELLEDALRSVAQVPDSDAASHEASAILSDALRPGIERLEREVSRSPAATALRAGTKRLTYSAVTASTGAALGASLGQPILGTLLGATSGLSGNLTQSIGEYLASRRQVRSTKAVLDIAMSFVSVSESND